MIHASLSRMAAIAKKEIAHIARDPFTIAMALGMPVVMVLIFGTAFEFNLDRIPLAVYDGDKSASSRQLVETFTSSGHFIAERANGANAAAQALDGGHAKAALIISPGFERNLIADTQNLNQIADTQLQILVDGSDSTSASSVLGYLPLVQRRAQYRLLGISPQLSSVQLEPRFHFNPELRTKWFMVPGLGVVILAILSILLTSLTIAREWETGSMELLLSTPVRPVEIIAGKLLPYLFLGLAGAAFVYLSARLVFGVPFRGSHLLYLLGCVLFITTCMAQGLLISVVTRAQQVAMQAAMMSGLLPSLYLSGFMYPIEHMPVFFRYLTAILAPRWFMQISHSLYLRGSTFAELTKPFLALTAICGVIISLAAIHFKKDVEP